MGVACGYWVLCLCVVWLSHGLRCAHDSGNKFEFRAVGASMTPHRSNYVLNTILAESLSHISACARVGRWRVWL